MRILGRDIPNEYLIGGGLGLGALLVGRSIGLLGGAPSAPAGQSPPLPDASGGGTVTSDDTLWGDVGQFPSFPTPYTYWDPEAPPASTPGVNAPSAASQLPIAFVDPRLVQQRSSRDPRFVQRRSTARRVFVDPRLVQIRQGR